MIWNSIYYRLTLILKFELYINIQAFGKTEISFKFFFGNPIIPERIESLQYKDHQ